jgi:hypothetical protein
MEIKDECEYFRCQICGTIIEVNQESMNKEYHHFTGTIWYPIECDKFQGGCGRKSIFYRIKKEWLKECESKKEKADYSKYTRELIDKDRIEKNK